MELILVLLAMVPLLIASAALTIFFVGLVWLYREVCK